MLNVVALVILSRLPDVSLERAERRVGTSYLNSDVYFHETKSISPWYLHTLSHGLQIFCAVYISLKWHCLDVSSLVD